MERYFFAYRIPDARYSTTKKNLSVTIFTVLFLKIIALTIMRAASGAEMAPYFASTRAQMRQSAKHVLDWPDEKKTQPLSAANVPKFGTGVQNGESLTDCGGGTNAAERRDGATTAFAAACANNNETNEADATAEETKRRDLVGDRVRDPNSMDVEVTAHRRLIEDLLDPLFYERTVHPRRNYNEPTRVNLSMSLYQILDVEERQQSIMVNVWMVQDWYDEFLDWNPLEYEMINKTIVPYKELWLPDTCLYNAETLEQKRTEALMNAIVETGYWRNDSRGAYVQLMFPAIYTLSCKMNVRFFPYDHQNCSFIISSWTHDASTIDYYAKTHNVNLKNFARNEEWDVISFDFYRIEQFYKCCPRPWVMLYAHLVIKRKPLYYIINLVIPTSIITIVAVTGFFTPSSTSSERDEKLYLGINTLLTMSVMMLMVCNQMPSTSSYVPLMGWYYMVIIFVIVVGTMLATVVLFIHSQKQYARQLPPLLQKFCTNCVVWAIILRPPANLIELWSEFGLISETRCDTTDDDDFADNNGADSALVDNDPSDALGLLSSMSSARSALLYERQVASMTKQYVRQMRERERQERHRRETLADAVDFLSGRGAQQQQRRQRRQASEIQQPQQLQHDNSRLVKKQKMMRRCSMEWEYLANLIDRILLCTFCMITVIFFVFLVFFDHFFETR